jgi:hypothetical protein
MSHKFYSGNAIYKKNFPILEFNSLQKSLQKLMCISKVGFKKLLNIACFLSKTILNGFPVEFFPVSNGTS